MSPYEKIKSDSGCRLRYKTDFNTTDHVKSQWVMAPNIWRAENCTPEIHS